MSWHEVEFETLYAEQSRNGIYKPKEFHGSGAKIVNMGELFAHEFIGIQDMARLAMSEHELSISGLKDGDLLFGRRSLVEAGAGKCSLVEGLSEPTTFESSIIRVRVRQEACDPTFLYYWFRSPLGRGRIRSIVSGTNVKGIRGSDLRHLMVPCPDLTLQRGVVQKIKAYDDLIENNRRRIALLEEASRLLYREWFVQFRFPGHEHVVINNGVPANWRRTLLFQEAQPTYGYAFKSQLFNNEAEGMPVIRIRDVPNGLSKTWTTEEAPADRRVVNGDLLIGMDGDFHINFWSGGEGWLNQRVTKLTATGDLSSGFLRLLIEKPIKDLNETITGTTVKHLGDKHLRNIQIVVPPPLLLAPANELFENTRRAIVNLAIQNQRLAEARDLLLPRLMSGEIAV